MEAERSEKARGHNTDMDVTGESDSSIVPKKPANKGGVPQPAESVEGRGLTKENTEQSEFQIEDVAKRNPKAKGAKPEEFVNLALLKELDQSGFIDKLYKR